MTKQILLTLALLLALISPGCKKPATDNQPAPNNASAAPNLFRVKQDGKIGFIDEKGAIVIPITLVDVGDFSEGLATFAEGAERDYIDTTGKRTGIGKKYEQLSSFSEGMAWVNNRDGKFGCINRKGELVIPRKYAFVSDFSDGLAAVRDTSEKDGYVDRSGKLVIPPTSEYYGLASFSEGLAVVTKNSKHGYINKAGKIVIPLDNEIAADFHEGIGFVQRDRAWLGLDTNGAVVIQGDFSSCAPFSEERAAVKIGEKWGFIDHSGKLVIPALYDRVVKFSEGLAAVVTGGKWGFIDSDGKMVITPQFEWQAKPGPGWRIPKFTHGLARIRLPDGSEGYIDKTGAWVWQPTK